MGLPDDMKGLNQEMAEWFGIAITHPAAFFVADVKFGGKNNDVRGGMIVALGDEAAKVQTAAEKRLKAILDGQKTKDFQRVQIAGQTWYQVKYDKDGPVILFGFKGGYFLAGVGQGSLEAMLARMDKEPPKWFTAIAQQVPVPRRTGVVYLNLKKLRDLLMPRGKMGDYFRRRRMPRPS